MKPCRPATCRPAQPGRLPLQVSIGSDAVDAAEAFLRTGHASGESSVEQISWVSQGSLCQGALHLAMTGAPAPLICQHDVLVQLIKAENWVPAVLPTG